MKKLYLLQQPSWPIFFLSINHEPAFLEKCWPIFLCVLRFFEQNLMKIIIANFEKMIFFLLMASTLHLNYWKDGEKIPIYAYIRNFIITGPNIWVVDHCTQNKHQTDRYHSKNHFSGLRWSQNISKKLYTHFWLIT